jgi:hypothetical protein
MRSPLIAAAEARRALRRMARPAGDFDASRYFRGAGNLGFYNVGTGAMRALARSIHAAHGREWSMKDAIAFADALISDRVLDVKSVGIEVVARYRRDFTPGLPVGSAGSPMGTQLTGDDRRHLRIPHRPADRSVSTLAERMRAWSRHHNLWVARFSDQLIRRSVTGCRSTSYAVARTLTPTRKSDQRR